MSKSTLYTGLLQVEGLFQAVYSHHPLKPPNIVTHNLQTGKRRLRLVNFLPIMQLKEVIQTGTQRSLPHVHLLKILMVCIPHCAGNDLTIFAALRHPGCLMYNLPKDHILKSHLPKKINK